MKTLLFTLEYPPFHGGVANYYGNLAKYWPISEKMSILNNDKGELNKGSGFLSWWPALFSLHRKLSKEEFGCLLVGQILPLGTVAYIISWLKPIKYTVFLHGMDFALAIKSPRKQFLSKLILRRADKIICANSYVQDRLIEFLPEASVKTRIVNPGIEGGAPAIEASDILEIKNQYHLENKTVLLSLGRLVKRKGVDMTIEALSLIPEEQSKDIIYFIAGAGPREEYLKKLVPPRLLNKIIFLGSLSNQEKWTWLKICDIFVMPSRDISGDFEGFGIVYLEANLSGKPVIAGNSGGVRDAVVDGVSGLMVDPEKIPEIKETIINLVKNPELRDRLGHDGKARALKDFDWENQAIKVWQFIK